jgi:hypothetical protein
MGLGYPPDWGEYTARLRPGDLTVLEEGMTFHTIPGIWQDDLGVEISETFHVTAISAETLAEFPRKLFLDLITQLRLLPLWSSCSESGLNATEGVTKLVGQPLLLLIHELNVAATSFFAQ